MADFRSFQGIITGSQWCTAPLVNKLLMIRDLNFVVQFSGGTSLTNYDTDTMILQVATSRLA